MKRALHVTAIVTLLLFSCNPTKQYYSKAQKKGGQKKANYHLAQSKKVVTQNEKNRGANIKAGDKKQAQIQENLNLLNDKKTKQKRDANTGHFNFY